MTGDLSEKADEYFNCNERERAAFELGIKLGALFHQFIGAPVSEENVEILEKAMEKTSERQAFVKSTEVKIDLERRNKKGSKYIFDYTTLTEDMIKAKVKIEFKGIVATGVLEYIDELQYPLMYIEKIEG